MPPTPVPDLPDNYVVVLYRRPGGSSRLLCSRFWQRFDSEHDARSWAESKRPDPRYAYYRIEERSADRVLDSTGMVSLKPPKTIPGPDVYIAWERLDKLLALRERLHDS